MNCGGQRVIARKTWLATRLVRPVELRHAEEKHDAGYDGEERQVLGAEQGCASLARGSATDLRDEGLVCMGDIGDAGGALTSGVLIAGLAPLRNALNGRELMRFMMSPCRRPR